MTETLIGASLPRPDALGKVTGATRYPGDLLRPGMLHLKLVLAARPHARIVALDTSAALALPGVHAVLTAADVPYNAYGLIAPDQPALCGDVVRYVGDKVALVVAETPAVAEAAARLVQVSYENLPAVFDAEQALAPDAPVLHAAHGSNLLFHFPIHKGDIAQGFAEADIVLEGNFSTSWQDHAYLQPEAGIAYCDEQGRVVIETAGQWLHEDRHQIAAMLHLPEEQVIVRYAAIGGAFGGREDLSLQHLLALAAWQLKRPVAMVWDRAESMIIHHKRHPVTIRCRWGARRDGTITAVEASAYADGGAYASTSSEVVKCIALFLSGCYEVPHIKADAYAVYTNNVPSGAFRGFGAPQAQFASESMIARLAEALAIDPIELRRKNLYREGSIEPTQHPLPPGVSVRKCLDAVVKEQKAEVRSQKSAGAQPFLRRGWGIACGIKNLGYSFGFPEQATATVELFGEHSIEHAHVRVGAAEVGQGTHTILRQIVAEALALPFEQVTIIADDSGEAPNAGSASASRLTLMAGRAVYDAALAARREWQNEERPARATVQYFAPQTTPLDPQTTAGVPNFAYAYAAQAVEVEVDTRTGLVQVLTVISAHDVGRAINRQQVEGQIEGGVVQGLGYVLLEDYQMRNGQVITPHFSSYLLPTALDVPLRIVPLILEHPDREGAYGARGVAELPLVPLPGAVAAAIHQAVGLWPDALPITPERVLAALG
jgi:CO/xanthine dehydrogenase Mo-binding subunit